LFDTSKLLNISDITKIIGSFFKLPIQLFYGVPYPELAYIESELLKDAVIALLVSFAQITPRHGFADAEMVEFPSMGFHRYDEIAKALTI